MVRSPCDEEVARSGVAGARACARKDAPWVLAATILGSSMAFIDGTVVNVALPALQAGLRATMVDLQWVVEAYALFLAALLLPGGSLGDRFGRRRVFVIGVAVFAAASIGCGLASDVRQLVLARAVQGVGAALLVPGSLAILAASFSDRDRGRAIGTWSGFTSITTALGPVAGGWLIDNLSWRAAFFVNVPIAAAVLVITAWRVPESRGDETGTIDWAGSLLATLGLGGVVYGLIESSDLGWRNARVVAALALGVVATALFVIVERRVRRPMLPPQLFRSRNFTGANLLTLFLYAAIAGVFFFIPLDLIQVQGYTAEQAGAAVLPAILVLFSLSRWSGGLFDRIGPRIPLIFGPVIAAGGLFLFTLPRIGGSYWTTFFPAMVVLGAGMAVTVAPLTTTVMSSVGAPHAGVASGINNAVSRVAGLLAIAILSVVMLVVFERRLNRELTALGEPPQIRAALHAQRTRLAAAELPAGVAAEDRSRLRGAIAVSFVSGFRRMMTISAGLALLASVTAVVCIRRDRGQR